MLIQDYFDEIIRFQITNKETASEAGFRLWNLIERVPRLEMAEDITTGFAISVLSQKDPLIRRELNSHVVTTRAQLFRILNGVSLKRRHDEFEACETDTKRARITDYKFNGSCHFCGNRGHKIEDCRKRRDIMKLKTSDKDKTVTCFTCGKSGHLSPSCPDKKLGAVPATRKEVQICTRRTVRGDPHQDE
ncbi:uncharacterized protein LOC132902891 isoform X1 [Amyelois transitella]|uniref:uncharacterized protein LOC132902891 isoform X1 n=1 Tax=Amyelois transitella TaxID=680683 RepID=UPI00298FE9F2|nr:uncharacterized protein LOC132902891 isoform X1 [Amyelois transitella]